MNSRLKPKPYGLIVRVLAYAGLRWGELAALRVRVDLTRLRLLPAESVTDVNGRVVFGTPKTHQRRSVPLPSFLVEPMAAQIAARRVMSWCLHPPAAEGRTTTKSAGGSLTGLLSRSALLV